MGMTVGPVAGEEVERLRTEVAVLRARLDRDGRRRALAAAGRPIAAALLIAIGAFALVGSVVGVWSARTALDTERWVAATAPLPRDPRVAAAVAEFASTQVFQLVDVEQRLRQVLPQQAAFAAGPLAGQLQGVVRGTVGNVLRSDRFQPIWTEVNRRAHRQVVALVEGRSDVVQATGDRVEIDLLPLINQVLRQVSAQLPTLFGKRLSLPDLSSGALPANLRARVQDALGVSLPADFAQFTVYDSGRLHALQDAVADTKRGLALAVLGTAVLLGAALAVSTRRRRTLLQLGIWLVVAAVAVTAVLRAVRREILGSVPAGVYRDGVAAALTTVLGGLRSRGVQLIWLGVVIALLAYLAGPGRVPVWLRGEVVRGWRRAGHVPAWVAAHLDAVRIGAVVVAAILALLLSSWQSLLVLAGTLAAVELGLTLLARSSAPGEPERAAVAEP